MSCGRQRGCLGWTLAGSDGPALSCWSQSDYLFISPQLQQPSTPQPPQQQEHIHLVQTRVQDLSVSTLQNPQKLVLNRCSDPAARLLRCSKHALKFDCQSDDVTLQQGREVPRQGGAEGAKLATPHQPGRRKNIPSAQRRSRTKAWLSGQGQRATSAVPPPPATPPPPPAVHPPGLETA